MSEHKTSDRRLAVLRPFTGRGGRSRRGSRPSEPTDGTSPTTSPTKPESSVVDAAIYRDGDRVASPSTLAETYDLLDEDQTTMAWIGLYRPNERQLASLADQFDLHELALEDAILAHQRPKLERYDQTLFVVLRAARYLDDVEEVEFGELHVFIGENFVVTVRHSESPDLSAVRRRMESNPDLLDRGPEAVLYAIMDRVVDGYLPVVAGLENDIDEIETEVFRGDPSVSRRIYELSREVIEFQRATRPLLDMLTRLSAGASRYHVDEELQRYLRDVRDHVEHVTERVDGFRQMLQDILTVNATLVAQKQNEDLKLLAESGHAQNEEIKKISAWAAILFAPTLIGTAYGMNFDNMPETSWTYGYPFALVLMAATCLTLYLIFKGRDWL
ncbi:MAG TPA: magnesium/cobalt transporter CorA [Nocardioidaceae bacterium]|nr:magnesium/cobalt transporter CorA [Nocardioidaceae bacterium]